MIRWFRRRRPKPQPAPALSRIDASTMHAWGISFLDWADYTTESRAWFRANLTKAPHFTSK